MRSSTTVWAGVEVDHKTRWEGGAYLMPQPSAALTSIYFFQYYILLFLFFSFPFAATVLMYCTFNVCDHASKLYFANHSCCVHPITKYPIPDLHTGTSTHIIWCLMWSLIWISNMYQNVIYIQTVIYNTSITSHLHRVTSPPWFLLFVYHDYSLCSCTKSIFYVSLLQDNQTYLMLWAPHRVQFSQGWLPCFYFTY